MRWPGLLKQGEVQNDYKTEGETNFDVFVLPHCFTCYVRSVKYLFLIPLKAVLQWPTKLICNCIQPSIVFVLALIHLIALSNSSLAISRCYSLPYLISNCQAKHNIALVFSLITLYINTNINCFTFKTI